MATTCRQDIKTLPHGWEARLGLNGRVYYISHHSKTVQILPPPESWSCAFDLPYGWECAIDHADKPYYLNHIMQQVTYEDPRMIECGTSGSETTSCEQDPPVPRQYEIVRHERLGFGFIAGSEKPVIIRTVSPGGPSENRLLPGDQIIKIGDEDVKNAPRERVIDLIRGCTKSVTMTVLQPRRVASSSFLKPGKKLIKGMNRPRVRFADDNTFDVEDKSAGSSRLLVVPGVLRVFLEEGQSRSFQFNPETTAGDIVSALCDKLDIKDSKFYSLVFVPAKDKSPNERETSKRKTSDEVLIAPWDCIGKTLSNPALKHHQCHFRLTFVPKDVHKLAREDFVSFTYHYQQCLNDVVTNGLYDDDLSTDDFLRLASFQMLVTTLVHSSGSGSTEQIGPRVSKKNSFQVSNKVNLKQIEKDYGLACFLPAHVLKLVQDNHLKEHRKILQQFLKTNYTNFVLNANGSSSSASAPPVSPNSSRDSQELSMKLQMQYIKLLSPHHLYGGRYFEATILALIESDVTLIVGYHYGVSQLINSKTKMASIFSDFPLVQSVEVAPFQPNAIKTNVRVDFKDMAPLVLSMHPLSAQNFAFMISGYCRVQDNNDMMLTLPFADSATAPDYSGLHKVRASHWNYPPEDKSDLSVSPSFFYCDFSEVVGSSMLSHQIPASVRAMYQQSKMNEDELSRHHSSASETAGVEESQSSKPSSSTTTDDEGVAVILDNLSPLPSVASTTSTSPSSGIGSVLSQQDGKHFKDIFAEENVKNSSPEEEDHWNELMVAVYNNDDLAHINDKVFDNSSRNSKESDKGPHTNQEGDSNKIDEKKASDDAVEEVLDDTKTDEESNATEDIKEFRSDVYETGSIVSENESSANKHADNKSTDTVDERESGSVQQEKRSQTEVDSSSNASSSTQLHSSQRPRFSSFKPLDPNEETDVPAAQDADRFDVPNPSSGNGITSEELSANLGKEPLKLDVAASQLGAEEEDKEEEIVASPLPVTDLARGHKSLKDKKQKNRMSWFGGSTLSRSVSLDKGLGKSAPSPKSRSFFRFFSTSRSYNVGKEKSTSVFALSNPEPLPESVPESSSRWKFISFLRSPTGSNSSKNSGFSFFKRFSRRKRSHDFSSPGNVSPPVVSDSMPAGVYSTLDSDNDKLEIQINPNPTAIQSSLGNVQMRTRDKTDNLRPVSFSTFQRLPSGFQPQLSPGKSPKSIENTPGKLRMPNLPIDAEIHPPLVSTVSKNDKEVEDTVSTFITRLSETELPSSSRKSSTTSDGTPSKATRPTKPIRQHLRTSSSTCSSLNDVAVADILVEKHSKEEDGSLTEEDSISTEIRPIPSPRKRSLDMDKLEDVSVTDGPAMDVSLVSAESTSKVEEVIEAVGEAEDVTLYNEEEHVQDIDGDELSLKEHECQEDKVLHKMNESDSTEKVKECNFIHEDDDVGTGKEGVALSISDVFRNDKLKNNAEPSLEEEGKHDVLEIKEDVPEQKFSKSSELPVEKVPDKFHILAESTEEGEDMKANTKNDSSAQQASDDGELTVKEVAEEKGATFTEVVALSKGVDHPDGTNKNDIFYNEQSFYQEEPSANSVPPSAKIVNLDTIVSEIPAEFADVVQEESDKASSTKYEEEVETLADKINQSEFSSIRDVEVIDSDDTNDAVDHMEADTAYHDNDAKFSKTESISSFPDSSSHFCSTVEADKSSPTEGNTLEAIMNRVLQGEIPGKVDLEKDGHVTIPDVSRIVPITTTNKTELDFTDFPPPPDEFHEPSRQCDDNTSVNGHPDVLPHARTNDKIFKEAAGFLEDECCLLEQESLESECGSQKRKMDIEANQGIQANVPEPCLESDKALNQVVSPNKTAYHSLITPRLFDHQREVKSFSKIKLPSNIASKTNGNTPQSLPSDGVNRKTDFEDKNGQNSNAKYQRPTSNFRSVRPPVPSKPILTS
ncbi:uncharacterized protein LOC143447572 [Clavelina lepadiformis]|uniref:uncharacterized protein LOC143447572 n=1 Tax=Clavelina lepadiformis TaxID=159417 RepID=UPI004042DA42